MREKAFGHVYCIISSRPKTSRPKTKRRRKGYTSHNWNKEDVNTWSWRYPEKKTSSYHDTVPSFAARWLSAPHALSWTASLSLWVDMALMIASIPPSDAILSLLAIFITSTKHDTNAQNKIMLQRNNHPVSFIVCREKENACNPNMARQRQEKHCR